MNIDLTPGEYVGRDHREVFGSCNVYSPMTVLEHTTVRVLLVACSIIDCPVAIELTKCLNQKFETSVPYDGIRIHDKRYDSPVLRET